MNRPSWNVGAITPQLQETRGVITKYSPLVDRLAARGLLQRVPDPSDRRVKHLVLTDEGRNLRARLQARLFVDSPAIDALQPAERFQFLQLLRVLTPEIPANG